MPTGRSSADVAAHPGPAASLALLLGLRARGLRTPARIAVVIGVALLVAVTVVSVALPSQMALAPELVDAMRRYLPVGFLAFVVTTATAVLFGGGGREALPAEQVVAYPVGPTTDHLAGLVLAPLNLAWLLQAWTLLASVAVLTRGAHTWAAVLPVVLWLVAVTVAVQWLSWMVEYVRRGPRGELIVRTTATRRRAGHRPRRRHRPPARRHAVDARGLGVVAAVPRRRGRLAQLAVRLPHPPGRGAGHGDPGFQLPRG